MGTPLSLRVARLLLVAAGAFTAGVAVYIAARSQDPVAASPWLVLLLLNAAGFVASAVLLGRKPRRAKLLAVASAIAMGALGTITGFGAGMLSFPAAGVGALGAWAALLTPPRRPMVLAFIAYLVVGVATVGPAAAYPFLLPSLFIWPMRLLLFPAMSIVPIYLFLGVAASVAVVALTDRRRALVRRPTPLVWALAFGISLIAGVVAVILFQIIAFMRLDTSARFELDTLVLALVFLGGAFTAAGVLGALRLRPSLPGALALGLGAAALFMTFTYRPAVTCTPGGSGQGLPLSWVLRAPLGSDGMTSSGSGTTSGGGSGATSTGRFQSGGREAVFRCDGDRLVEYREVSR